MAFAVWLRALSAALRPGARHRSGLFLDEKCFRYEMARECMRVDRNGSPLAVLTIDLPPSRASTADFEFLGRLLLRRLRITDTIGFLAERQIGVLLPDTPKAGAWKVASDICSIYPVGHDRPNCEVFVYPDDADTRNDNSGHPDHKKLEQPSAGSIESLFAQPNPKWKRAIDVLGACIGIIVSAPLMLIFAAAIKLTSRGPVFYAQWREGMGGQPFRIYKFRTMRAGAELHQPALRSFSEQDGPAFKMREDPRTTWIGRWLRATSLDELPQFWNVLRGDMSL